MVSWRCRESCRYVGKTEGSVVCRIARTEVCVVEKVVMFTEVMKLQ